MYERSDYLTKLAAVMILLVGCFLVLRPFLTATLMAAVVCISTWPLYIRLLIKMKGKVNLAALIMTISLSIVVILPLALVAYNLADNVMYIYNEIKLVLAMGPLEPPTKLGDLPFIGNAAKDYWDLISTSQSEMNSLLKRLLEPTKNFLLAGGIFLGQGVIEMSLAAFISFFFYRNGLDLLRFMDATVEKIVGNQSQKILNTIYNTVQSVMYGLLGTALAQGLVATIGFAIAGVPTALLLGSITAILSLLPVGPPLIWGAAAIWLLYKGSIAWAIFMLIWGILFISSVDNVVKPLLISRGSNLPFLMILFGVLGGIIAFGFIGVFIGPTLLAVGFSLLKEWADPTHNKNI